MKYLDIQQICKIDLGYMDDRVTYFKCPICGNIIMKDKLDDRKEEGKEERKNQSSESGGDT